MGASSDGNVLSGRTDKPPGLQVDVCSMVLVWACHGQIVNPIQRLSVLNAAELWWQKRFAILCQSAGSAGSCNQTPDFTGMWLLLGSSQITLWWKSTETKCAGAKCCRFSLNHRPHLSWTEPGGHLNTPDTRIPLHQWEKEEEVVRFKLLFLMKGTWRGRGFDPTPETTEILPDVAP